MTKLVETVQPTVDFSYHKYLQAHDVVVASEAYNRALETASAIIHKVGWRIEQCWLPLAEALEAAHAHAQLSNCCALERKAAEHALNSIWWPVGGARPM